MKHILRIIAPSLLLATGCGLKPHPLYRSHPRPAPGGTASAAKPAPRPATASAKKIQSIIDAYLGTPYRYGGSTKKGIDCSGLVQKVFRQAAGLELPRTAADMYRQGKKVSRRKLRYGDLVFFGKSVSSIDHVGIYVGDGRFAHASSSRGVSYAGLGDRYFRRRYRGAVRVIR